MNDCCGGGGGPGGKSSIGLFLLLKDCYPLLVGEEHEEEKLGGEESIARGLLINLCIEIAENFVELEDDIEDKIEGDGDIE